MALSEGQFQRLHEGCCCRVLPRCNCGNSRSIMTLGTFSFFTHCGPALHQIGPMRVLSSDLEICSEMVM